MQDSANTGAPSLTPEEYAQSLGASLRTLDGRIVLRIAGTARPGRRSVTYDLVPNQGVLAKAGKWRKLGHEERLRLIGERAGAGSAAFLQAQVEQFLAELEQRAGAAGLDPQPFIAALEQADSPDPAELVFERIRLRLEHALVRRQEELYAKRTRDSINLAEYPASFELAYRLPRRFIALLGPTNSGKTHQALQALAQARSGVYLAPLRLLALENYERLAAARPRGQALKVSLVTGEERREVPDATHVASTVEMLDIHTRVEVAVIDEIQMLGDRERGAAWTAAVCGVPADTVYLVGAQEARRAVEALAQRLECPLEVHILKRKGALTMEPEPVRKLSRLRRGDAVTAFSRREVLMWRDLVAEQGHSVATVYGNLSPEVRRAQAARFYQGQADIVVGTDAIAMGLNLPIQRVVMSSVVKYNGVEEEEIPAALARQIAGRAGRYGVHEAGFVAGFDAGTHQVLRALLKEKPAPVAASGFSVAPSLEYLHRIAAVTGEQSLARLLKRFIHNIDVPDGFFFPRVTEEQAERALWLDTLPLAVADKFTLSLVPVSSRLPVLHQAWQGWARSWAHGKALPLQPDPGRLARMNLQEVEDSCRLYSAYAWLSYRCPEYFPSGELAQELARAASERVDALLRTQNAGRRKRQGRQHG